MAKITLKSFRKALEGSSGNLTKIAQRLDRSRQAVYDFLAKNPSLREEIEQEAEKLVDLAEAQQENLMKEGDIRAVENILLRSKRGRARGYGERVEVDSTLQVANLQDMLQKDKEIFESLPDEIKDRIINKI